MDLNGDFGYDFKIAEVLRAEEDKPINRVFTIFFSSESEMISFFSDEDYLAVKRTYFINAVSSVLEIAKYKK